MSTPAFIFESVQGEFHCVRVKYDICCAFFKSAVTGGDPEVKNLSCVLSQRTCNYLYSNALPINGERFNGHGGCGIMT